MLHDAFFETYWDFRGPSEVAWLDRRGSDMSNHVLGVYPVEAVGPCHLVELFVDSTSPLDFVAGVTQEFPGEPRDNWQVPWDEHALDTDGERELGRQVGSPCRIVFFFHYLDLDRPLLTPTGPLRLPPPTERPERLAFLRYEAPC